MSLLTKVTTAYVVFKSSISNLVPRLLNSKLEDSISVKDFGAKGDWNTDTQTGADDTQAIQNAINYLASLGSRRKGGKLCLRFPAGVYRVAGKLHIPSSIHFGLEIVGDGWASTCIRWDQTNPDYALECDVEYISFRSLGLFGTLSDSTPFEEGKPKGFKHKLASNRPDIDVIFRDCLIQQFDTFIYAYGRGVTFDHCVIGFTRYLMNIVASTDTTFLSDTSPNNGPYTGMRHYAVRNCRFDVCSRVYLITGEGKQREHINGILFANNDMTYVDVLIEGADAGIRRAVIADNVGLQCFASGVIQVKHFAFGTITGNNFSKGYDDYNGTMQSITSLIIASGVVSKTVISGNNIRGIKGNIVDAQGACDGVTISNNTFPHAWENNVQTNCFVFYSPQDCNQLVITDNTFPSASTAFVYNMFWTSQKSKRTIVRGNLANWSWTIGGLTFSPVVSATTGTWTNRATWRYESGKVYMDFMLTGTGVTDTTGNITMTLPVPTKPSTPAITSGYSGGGSIHRTAGFEQSGAAWLGVDIGQTLATFTRTTNLLPTPLTWGSRNSSVVSIYGSLVYQVD